MIRRFDSNVFMRDPNEFSSDVGLLQPEAAIDVLTSD
jgi:hypothetical protein